MREGGREGQAVAAAGPCSVGPAASSWLVRRRRVLLCLIIQGLKRADAMKQQGGMDPFGSVFEAFGFGGREGGRSASKHVMERGVALLHDTWRAGLLTVLPGVLLDVPRAWLR